MPGGTSWNSSFRLKGCALPRRYVDAGRSGSISPPAASARKIPFNQRAHLPEPLHPFLDGEPLAGQADLEPMHGYVPCGLVAAANFSAVQQGAGRRPFNFHRREVGIDPGITKFRLLRGTPGEDQA